MAVAPETLDVYDDRRMVAAFQAGDEDAFCRIVGTYYRSLLAEARRRLRSDGEAEDAVQETLLRAYLALDRFGGEFRLRAWLSRILANACNDALARRAGELRLYDRLSHRRAEEPAADEDIGDSELRRKIKEAVESLPSSYRVAFVLRDIEERSYSEVADEMSVTEPNARARVHRARNSLARTLRNTGGALGGFVFSFRFISSRWLGRYSRASGGVGPNVARRAAGTVRAGHCTVPLSATTTSAGASKPGLFTQTSRQTLVDLSSLSQAAASPAAQDPLSPLPSISQVIAQVAASPLSQTLLAAAPDAARASAPIAGTIATLAVAGAAMISSGGGLAPPPAATGAPPQFSAAAPASLPSGSAVAAANNSSGKLPASAQALTSNVGAGSSVSVPVPDQWAWVGEASTEVPANSASGSVSNGAPAVGPSAPATPLVSCSIGQWFGGATTPSLPPPEPAGAIPSAFFASDTLDADGINPSFVATGGGTFSNSSGVFDLHTYYAACGGGSTGPGLGVQLSNPGDPSLGVLQLTGAFVSSETSGGSTFTLYRGEGTWIGGQGATTGPIAFAAQVEVDEPSSRTVLSVAFFGEDPGLAGPITQESASTTPAGPASGNSPPGTPQSASTQSSTGPAAASAQSQTPGAAAADPASSNSSSTAAGATGGTSPPVIAPADPGSSAASRHG